MKDKDKLEKTGLGDKHKWDKEKLSRKLFKFSNQTQRENATCQYERKTFKGDSLT